MKKFSIIGVIGGILVASMNVLAEPPVLHSRIGETMTATNGALTITNIGKKQNRDYRDTATLDHDVFSPKSVNFHPDGTK